MGKDLIIKLCKRIVNNEKLNIGDFEYCDGIDCYKDSCPFAEKFNCILTESRKLEIAKKYLKDNEVKEENKMEKTFREVIADIKVGEVWENIDKSHWNLKEINCFDNDGRKGIRIVFKEETDYYTFTDNENLKFKLKRKQYTFEEAFKAYEEGEVVESEDGFIYKKINGQDCVCSDETRDWVKNDGGFSVKEIRGKWYIND